MTETALTYQVKEIERRVGELERLEPAVVAAEVRSLGRDVQSLKRAFYTFAFSVVGSAVIFAFSVFSLLGRH